MRIEVLEPGALTTVQDTVGRSAWRHVGVPEGGAADPWLARLANRLVGNADDGALLEITLAGPTLRFDAPAVVALAGRLEATVDGLALPPLAARQVREGSVLRIGSGDDARGYLAVAGGLDVAFVLGSAGTDLRSGFGGYGGRALAAGDRLSVRGQREAVAYRSAAALAEGPIRIVPGPHAEERTLNGLTAGEWRIGPEADRIGARLDGALLTRAGAREVPSVGLPLGAIQLPPDGRPIVMLADRPVTGGYPVPAVVIGADVGRVARLRPGKTLRFASVSLEEARTALRQATEELAALEALEAPGDDELGWAGSHG